MNVSDDVKVLIADSAAEDIRKLTQSMTGKQQRMLIGWLERLTPEKLMDEGVALVGALKGKHRFQSEKYWVRFTVRDGAPVVLTLQVNS